MVAAEQPAKIIQARGADSTLIREPRGGKGLPDLAAYSSPNGHRREQGEAGQLAFTKWPRRFCCQQASLCSMQKGFSLPKLTVPRRSAEMPRDTRYCLTALARRSPRPRLYSVEPRSSQWPSMVALIDGYFFRKSAVAESEARASGRMSALSKSK